ncbi:TetR/AcrR family transcriptional regulator [Rhodococcus sp. (in: high G+C Gram-positive bacteria)]|uniref:TetR/AcrR family transcriptional regulator n=1 Tax=Rhodococcus sp. TaxID=1831 RepID=UPI00338FF568
MPAQLFTAQLVTDERPYHRMVRPQQSRSPKPLPEAVRSGNDLRRPYFEYALQLLATEGYGGLKLAPLCKRAGVTTGAFYYSFGSWKDFTRQLLEYWHAERTTRLVEAASAQSDPVERLELLLTAVQELPHRAEASIRAWSSADPEAAHVQRAVDHDRFEVAEQAFRHILADAPLARRYARAGVALLIGFEYDEDGLNSGDLAWSLRLLLDSARNHAGR